MMERAIDILLVEDSVADVRLTVEAFRTAGLKHTLHVVHDGEAALEFLRDAAKPRPDLVLLDLNLPGIDGHEVLSEIRGDDELGLIPVCVLSTSSAREDVLEAYRSHTNCYVVKPLQLDEFRRVISQIQAFWSTVAQLPPKPGAVDGG